MTTPRWITAEQVIALNESLLEGSTEKHLVRDLGALESAVARPHNRFVYNEDTSVSSLTAELIFGIGKAHAFEQGNKRTAWAAGRYFAAINGFQIEVNGFLTQHELARIIEKTITDDSDGSQLQKVIEGCLKPKSHVQR